MAYFLKQTKNKNSKGLYLQIYTSFYDSERKSARNLCHQTLGYASDLIAQGHEDPVAYGKQLVAELNQDLKKNKEENKIGDISPLRYLGYLPVKYIFERLHVDDYINAFQIGSKAKYSLSKCLESLVYARLVSPCSKHKTWERVLPRLYDRYNFSYDQILSALDILGSNYEKIVEVFTFQTDRVYKLNTEKTYFDCTNFYFEIDREDELRRKGPSKEHRTDPIMGLGLLLDLNCIPVGMKIYPGNQSEKPVIRELIHDLKQQNNIKGRTIQVADKGLNCAENIYQAKKAKDGYIFSKSVKGLNQEQRHWVLDDQGWIDICDEKGKLIYQYKSKIDQFDYKFKVDNGKYKKFKVKEIWVVTYNEALARKQTAEIDKLVDKAQKLCLSQAKKSEFGECSKLVNFIAEDKDGIETDDTVTAILDNEKVKRQYEVAGYNLLISSETDIKPTEIYNTYHNLWRIEESFRSMKSFLNARPVYLTKPERIYAHFLICYIDTLLERIFQFKILNNKFCTEEIYDFFHDFQVLPLPGNETLNVSTTSPLIEYLAKITQAPLTNYRLNKAQMKKVLNLQVVRLEH